MKNENGQALKCSRVGTVNRRSRVTSLWVVDEPAGVGRAWSSRCGSKDADGNRKWAVFPFNLFSHNYIYIAKYLFAIRDFSIKIWETPLSWHVKCSLPVAVHVSKTRVLKLPSLVQGDHEYFMGDVGSYCTVPLTLTPISMVVDLVDSPQ